MQLHNGLVVTRPSITLPSEGYRTYKSRFRYFKKMSQKEVMTSQSQKRRRAELIRPSGNFIMKEF